MCASLAIATVRCQGAWSYRHLLRPTAHYHNLSSNMLPKIQLFESSATCSVNMLPWETFRHTRSTCCRQQVAGNMFPKSCPKVAAGNMLLSTCCRCNMLPVATFGQLLVNMLPATCCRQHVASGNFWATFGQHVAGNMLPATCCQWQLSGNFWSTCCRQHVAGNLLPAATFGQLLGNMLPSTCCRQHVARMLTVCSGL